MKTAQISLLDELIVDNFAGGGGASTGIELATGRPVNIAINHDPDAVLMHKTNHPYTKHYCESVWGVDPQEVTHGQPVGLAWFSPDCKHFSKAKGGKPVDKRIRGLAWIVLRWAGLVRPRVIILENVEEFQTWGPVRHGKPDKKRTGETFRKWKQQLESLGYQVEHRELVAADYGAPTIRKRFFLVARCDGLPIVWPEPTHSRDGTQGKKKWRSAAEIIDWTLPCPSIFASRAEIKARYGINAVRPLADNTLRRVARGTDKFVIKAAQPFIVPVGYGERKGQEPRTHSLQDPLPTTVSIGKQYLANATMTPWTVTNTTNSTGHPADEPVDTARTGGGGGQMLVTAALTAIGHTGGGDRGRAVTEPTHTAVSKAEECIIAPSLIQYHSETKSEYVRGQTVDQPVMTVDAANRYGIAAAYMTEYYGNAQDGIDVREPMHTATAKDREGLTIAYMSKYYGGGYHGKGNDPADPLNTITAADHNALALAHVSKFYKTGIGQEANEPLHTITQSSGHFGEVRTLLVKYRGGQDLHHWPEVRGLLIKYCGYHIADDEILLMEIGGIHWFISDIGLRMLTPQELYAANGFPVDYIIDRDYMGHEYNKTKQVARCGNAVPPPFAAALVRANCPELCQSSRILTSMQQVNSMAAV